MDLDSEVLQLKRRIERLESEVLGGKSRVESHHSAHGHIVAREHLDAGDLDKAGAALKLDRAHGGEESDESYGRRLHAAVDGSVSADAAKPRPAPEAKSIGTDYSADKTDVFGSTTSVATNGSTGEIDSVTTQTAPVNQPATSPPAGT